MAAKHPTETPEYWERLARDERAFALHAPRTATAESLIIHRQNAAAYERRATALRQQLLVRADALLPELQANLTDARALLTPADREQLREVNGRA